MKRYVHNDTDAVKFVGGRMLQPGEGREIDLPDDGGDGAGQGEQPHAPPIDPQAEALTVLREQSVADITAQLPDISPELLELLDAAEQADAKPRSTLLSAIAAERLRRASAN